MSKYSIDSSTLTAIADAIREKGGTSDPILAESMAAAIEAIEVGGEWKVTSGEIVFSEEQILTGTWEIAHGLASEPLFAVVTTDYVLRSTSLFGMAAYGRRDFTISEVRNGISISSSLSGINMVAVVKPSIARYLSTAGTNGCSCDENNIYVYASSILYPGYVYTWYAGVKA